MRKILLLIASLTAFIFYANGQKFEPTWTTPGTYTFTVPENVYEIVVECWGGGGAGGALKSAKGNERATAGGGGGAYAKSTLNVTPGEQYTIVVGQGGISSHAYDYATSRRLGSGGPSYVAIDGVQKVRAAAGSGGGNGNKITNDKLRIGTGGRNSSTAPSGTDADVPDNYSIGDLMRAGGNGGQGMSGMSNGGSGGGGGGAGTNANGVKGGNGASGGIAGGAGGANFGGKGGNGFGNSATTQSGETYGGGGSGTCANQNQGGILAANNLNRNGGSGANGAVHFTYTIPPSYQFKIFANHTMTILPNTYVSIDASINNNGLMYIKSTEAGDGSLIARRNIVGDNNFKVERYMSPDKWHFMSSPVNHATSAMFKGTYLRKYSEADNAWEPYIKEMDVEFLPGEGFSAYKKDEDMTAIYSGRINNSNLTIPLTHNNEGWNLIGNPFTSAIDLKSQIGWSKTNVGNAVYTFDGVQEKYVYFLSDIGGAAYTDASFVLGTAADQYVAMGQGFFIHAINNSASITIKQVAQTHNTIKFKNEEYIPNLIRVKVDGNSRSDESALYITPNALDSYDYQRDALKLFDGYPQLYSKKQDRKFAISAYDDIDKINGKLLYLEVGETENYTISFTHSIENMDLYLKDLFTNTYISANETYKFTAKPDDINMRFEFVVMQQPSGIENEDFISTGDMHIWEYDNILYVNTRINEEVKSINIYNSIGELVLSSTSNQTNLNALPFGVYIVKVSTNIENKTTKVLIK